MASQRPRQLRNRRGNGVGARSKPHSSTLQYMVQQGSHNPWTIRRHNVRRGKLESFGTLERVRARARPAWKRVDLVTARNRVDDWRARVLRAVRAPCAVSARLQPAALRDRRFVRSRARCVAADPFTSAST